MNKEYKSIESINDTAMINYMRTFRRSKSHIESSDINSGRALLERLDITIENEFTSSELNYKSRVYLYPGYNFIEIDIELLDEEYKRKITNDLTVKSLDKVLSDLAKLGYNKTMDIYFDGEKINSKNINVIQDHNKFIFITDYEPYEISIIIREYVKDFRVNDSESITISRDDRSAYNNHLKMIFADGYKTNNFTEVINSNGSVTVTINEPCDGCEIVLLPKSAMVYIVPANANWVDVRPNSRLAINMDNIIPYMNGTLINITANRKGNSYFKVNEFGNYPRELIILHEENNSEDVISKGSIDWYRDNINSNVPKELNDGTAPTFVKYFNNCDVDTRPHTGDISKSNSLKYLTDKINEVIDYDTENFIEYINEYLNHKDNFSTSYILDMNEYGYNNYIRNDNRDVPSCKKDIKTFAFPMVMIVMDNPENKPFKVYVDGVALFRHVEIYYSMGTSYIYFRKNKVLAHTIVEIEVYNTNNKRIEDEVMIDNTGIYSLNHRHPHRINGLIDVYAIDDNDVFTKVQFTYNPNNCTIDIGKNKQGFYKIVVNNAVVYDEHVINCREITDITFNIPRHALSRYDIEHYRLYKNGKLIPRAYYTIEFPTAPNGVPKVTVNCKAHMSEQFCVEYNPYKIKDIYGENVIDNYGRVRLEQDTLGGYPLNLSIEAIYLNGRKLNYTNVIQNSSNTMELIKILSTKNFNILLKEDYDTCTNFPDFKDTYAYGFSGYDDYIKETMVGSIINDLEQDVLEKDYEIMRDLYWDLYNEYLKSNLVNFGIGGVPDYIAIKYADLVNHEDIIYIDCTEQMSHQMILDASMTHKENMDRLTDVYDEIMLNIQQVGEISPEIMDPELVNKYEDLTDKNILVLDLSHIIKLQ